MDKRVLALGEYLARAQSKARVLLKGKKTEVTARIRRAAAFIELAKGELVDFRRQFQRPPKARRIPKRKKTKPAK